ncbi:hypothetical protein DAPPUDRAFT_320256 [Daphnia pulex]|uniref:Uncharacterized protein n=1 Tax=Daphnia pulex TaxID=6669 RepID=E9GPC3_DAPPU|nr:hypothetical protein DAPPUDRAFT_320256 [Daphnia pulex]|eukprot:EFX78615.1 hypothetical protein DAPPUDRAFT_320256 [Daphnia pulex]
MLMNKSISLETVDLNKSVPIRRNSESDILRKGKFPPVTVRKSKLSLLRKVIPSRYSTRSTVDLKNTKLLDIWIPNSGPVVKKLSRWERTKAVIYNSPSLLAKTISFFQRTPASPESSADAGSETSLPGDPFVDLPTDLDPLILPEPIAQSTVSDIFTRAAAVLTPVQSDVDSEDSDPELGKEVEAVFHQPDESAKRSEDQLSSEPGVRGGRSVRPRHSTRIQPVSDRSFSNEFVGVENSNIRLPEYGKGDTASGIQVINCPNKAST